MADETFQDLVDSMSSDQKDAVALMLGAIASDDSRVGANTPVGDSTLGEVYNSLSLNQKAIVDFVAGGIDSFGAAEHADNDVDFLAHHGIKGMKWGVRKSGPESQTSVARRLVKMNAADLGDAHKAALKSTGHRILNGALGDKTYWKRTGIIAGLVGVGVGASLAAPAVLPTSMLTALGVHAIASGVTAPTFHVAGYAITTKVAALTAGKQAAEGIGLVATAASGHAAQFGNQVNNIARAATGNYRVNKSFEQLGHNMLAHQSQGSKRVQKLLKAQGVKIKHDDFDVEDFLKHHGIKGMKWGVRRGESSGGGRFSRGSKKASAPPLHPSQDHQVASTARKKHISELSNPELEALLKRTDLEQRYTKMMSRPEPAKAVVSNSPSKLRSGARFATNLVVSIGTHELQRVARTAASVMVEDRLTGIKRADNKELFKEVGTRLQPKQGKKDKGNNP